MKFSYSLLKKILPRIPAKEKVGELLNLHAFEVESIEDDTLDIKLPANRYSDAASHIGIAREIAASADLVFKNPVKRIVNPPTGRGLLRIIIEDKERCPRYAARVFDLERVGQSSKEVQNALISCGLKPINEVVDIMNFAMLETGQPLHAFDYGKLAGKENSKTIIVRRAKKDEKIETLDGQTVALDKEILVIADADRPQAIAGVKGGMASGVSTETKRIVVEAASFESINIFQTSRRLKLATDAALRFSHGMSPALVEQGLDRATELLVAAGAKIVDSAEVLAGRITEEKIEFDITRYRDLIGTMIDPKLAVAYFERLGFEVEAGKRLTGSPRFMVTIPAWRTDIENPEGLIEEVARIHGFEKLPSAPPVFGIQAPHEEDDVAFKEKSQNVLVNLHLDEVYNSSFISEQNAGDAWKWFGDPKAELVEIENPVAEDKKYLRPSLLPLLFENARENSRFFDAVRIFEFGKIFANVKGKTEERAAVSIVLAAKKNPRVALELKGLIEEFLEGVGVEEVVMVESENMIRIESDRHVLGTIGHRSLGKQWTAAFAELDFQKMLAAAEEEREYVPISRFPAVMRDVSVLVGREVRIGEIVDALRDVNEDLIENVDLLDEYKNEKLGGKQSLTFRIIFQAKNRTLTDAEVNKDMEKVANILKKKFRAEIR